MPQLDEVQARVLMTYPSDRWREYVDNIAIRSPAPTVAEIFAGMKMHEERQNARDEAEHGEANYAGRGGGEIAMENTFTLNMNLIQCPYTSGIHSTQSRHEFPE